MSINPTDRSDIDIARIISEFRQGTPKQRIAKNIGLSRIYVRAVIKYWETNARAPTPDMTIVQLNGGLRYSEEKAARITALAASMTAVKARAHPRTAWPDWFEGVPESRFMARRA